VAALGQKYPVEYVTMNGKKIHRIAMRTEKKYPVVHVFVKKFL